MKIIVVEDEAPIREGMAKVIETINPEYKIVGTAADGLSGYHLIMEKEPDLVIMDIRMPKIDGLEMLEKLRQDGCGSRFVVLSAYSEFDYAKRAIDSGIVSYMLKPIKLPELKKVLHQVEEVIEKEENRKSVFSIDTIMLGSLNGQLITDDVFDAMTEQRYGFTVNDPVEVMMVWLGDSFSEQKNLVHDMLKRASESLTNGNCYLINNESWTVVVLILYALPAGKSYFNNYRNEIVPNIVNNLKEPFVFSWGRANSLLDVPKTLKKIYPELEWNMWFEPGHLLNEEELDTLVETPVRYPIHLEERARQALLKNDGEGLKDSYRELILYFKESKCHPKQMKEMLIRFSWNLANIKSVRKEEANLRIHCILQNLAEAVTWEEIRGEMEEFVDLIYESPEKEQANSISDMVQKAYDLIQNYYSQGITLEETARKLFVSEEYLSTQFKKETGVSFTETVRKYRIEKVKQLLIDTPLKLNQIAELAGYSDPKYMSRVFKEEVGMLPGEFRKLSH